MSNKIKNVFIMFFGTGINMILGIITVPIITHIVQPAEYGMFSMLQTYITIFATVCLLGLEQAYIRFYYAYDTVEYKRNLSRKIIKYPAIIAICVSICVVIFGEKLFDVPRSSLVCMGLCIVITVFDTITRLSVRLEQNAKLYSVLLVVHRIVYAVLVIGLVVLLQIYSVNALLIGTFLSLLAIVIIAVIKERKIWFGNKGNSNYNVSFSKLFKYCYPFIFSSIANWIFNATDKLSLQFFSTYEEIGYYAAAANIVSLVTIIQTTFTTLWVPLAVENFENNPKNKQFYVKSCDYMCVIMFIIGSTVVLLKDVFAWMLGGNYDMAKFIFPCLVLQPVMFTLSEVTVYGINFYHKTQWHIVITVTSCIVNIIGNICLVPMLGGKGAAISTGWSYILFFIMRTIISHRYYKVPFAFLKLITVLILFVLFLGYNSFFATSILVIIGYVIFVGLICVIYNKRLKELVYVLVDYIRKKKIKITK